MQWNYQKIEYFLKVAETLNFSKAAKELFISPQSLNKQIIQLEKELGEALFERTTRQVKLTPLGKKMQHIFIPAREEFNKAVKTMEGYLQRREKTLRIAFYQAIFEKEVMEPILEHLYSREKDMQVEFLVGELQDIMEWLHGGACDLAITNVPEYESWKEVEIVPFMEKRAKIAIAHSHPWAKKKEITLKDMEEMPVLLMEHEPLKGGFYTDLKARDREYAPNFNTYLANLKRGTTYAVMPPLFSHTEQMDLEFKELPRECRFSVQLAAIYLKDNRLADVFESLKELAAKRIVNIVG